MIPPRTHGVLFVSNLFYRCKHVSFKFPLILSDAIELPFFHSNSSNLATQPHGREIAAETSGQGSIAKKKVRLGMATSAKKNQAEVSFRNEIISLLAALWQKEVVEPNTQAW